MEVGTLSSWLVKPGDAVEAGQVIAEIETDKSILEFEALTDGVIGELRVPEGTEDIKVDAVIAILLAPGEELGEVATEEVAPAAQEVTPEVVPASAPAKAARGRVKASPSARRIAREAGIAIENVTGTGPQGRIVAADVRAAADASPGASESDYEDIPQTTLQKTMARRMAESKATVPHLYAGIEVRMDDLLALRQSMKADGSSVTVNDFIVRAVALALRDTPDMNVQYHDGVVRKFRHSDVAVAVAGDGGLVTPIVFAAETKSIDDISKEVSGLAKLAADKRLRPEQYDGGSFTVSNVGVFGIRQSWPILNPPQARILGVGRAEPTPIADDGAIRVANVMKVTLAADHRCIDGAIVGDFMNSLRRYLEQPENLS
jgi:pyruvate dehydrogenase E2 component (dihydrolipoamide acetyltransferase)